MALLVTGNACVVSKASSIWTMLVVFYINFSPRNRMVYKPQLQKSYYTSKQGRILPTISPTSFWDLFEVCYKKSRNDSERTCSPKIRPSLDSARRITSKKTICRTIPVYFEIVQFMGAQPPKIPCLRGAGLSLKHSLLMNIEISHQNITYSEYQ